MISSEVQRTLVKSPPELWTELSDPESLARHLGELGEIRIARTEPENLVEWEAEGTTGTVEIAPSGWGTRVKLTVARELPAEAEEEAGIDAEEPAPAGPDAESGMADAAAAADADTVPAAPDSPPTALEAQAATPVPENEAAEPGAHEPAETALPGGSPENHIPERKPAPATEAARRAAGWPAGGHAPGPAIESDLRAAEALEGAPAEPDGMHEWAAQTIEPDEVDLEDGHVPEEEDEDPEPPRRGLFARLFGRRRARVKAALVEEPTRAEHVFEDSGETALEDVSSTEASELEMEEVERYDAATDEPEAVAQEPAEAAAGEDTEIEHADLTALGMPEPEPDTALGPQPSVPAIEADAEEPADPTAQTDPAGQAEQPPAAEAAQPAAPVEDPAAELRAAEEIAVEQVEAVLTGILDRLGSAHHRPFSRP